MVILFFPQISRLILEIRAALKKHLLPHYLARSEAFQDMETKSGQDPRRPWLPNNSGSQRKFFVSKHPRVCNICLFPLTFLSWTTSTTHPGFCITCKRNLFPTFLMGCLHEETDAFNFCKRLSTQAPNILSGKDALPSPHQLFLYSCFLEQTKTRSL